MPTEILEKISLLRSIIRESPLIQRTQDWPRKYQGDFETIERIIQCKNTARPYTWGYVFEDYFYFLEMVKNLQFLGQKTCVFFNFFLNLSI